MKYKSALIIPYFGEFPVWFELYLYSCSQQKGIDFIFYTNCTLPIRTYDNTIFHQVSFEDYCMMVSQKLAIDFLPSNPYKLCDLRPFYGIIHKEDLKGYDFWGFGDIDLLYGDLSYLVNDKILEKYDVVSAQSHKIGGHFTLVRKKSKYTGYCLRIKDWRHRLLEEKTYGFDEDDFTWLVHPLNRTEWRIYNHLVKYFHSNYHEYFNILHASYRLMGSRIYLREYYTTPIPTSETLFRYSLPDGRLSHTGLENQRYVRKKNMQIKEKCGYGKLYLHFLFFKKTHFLKTDFYWKGDYYKVPQGFNFEMSSGDIEITQNGIRLIKK